MADAFPDGAVLAAGALEWPVRATIDALGARWSNFEHPATPSVLTPRTGWAIGNAGIIRELLRYARLRDAQDPGYAIAWPDHPPAIPRIFGYRGPATTGRS